jgi:hypothetical protein
LREDRDPHTCENKASEYGYRQDILFDLLVSPGIGESKNDMLDLVVDSSACLESFGLGIGREVIEISLEEPKGLDVCD